MDKQNGKWTVLATFYGYRFNTLSDDGIELYVKLEVIANHRRGGY